MVQLNVKLLFIILSFYLISIFAEDEYYGTFLGSLKNESSGLTGDVYIANSSVIQIVNFNIDPQSTNDEISLVVSNSKSILPAKNLYQIILNDNLYDSYIIPIKLSIKEGIKNSHIVLFFPKDTDLTSFKFFGLISINQWAFYSKVKINKKAPTPFCCFTDEKNNNIGIRGFHYNAETGPIEVLDSKTILLKQFKLDGTRAPDGWILTGKGEVNKKVGKKAMVIGRDTKKKQCSLNENYTGETDLKVHLLGSQTIYNIDYISIFCYQYDVDFGHYKINLPFEQAVPAYIPPTKTAYIEQTILANTNKCIDK